jgi:hypothetical protein
VLDGEIELLWVLQKGEMACARQDQHSRVRDRRRDIFAIRPSTVFARMTTTSRSTQSFVKSPMTAGEI